MLHSMAQRMPHASKLTTAECAASLPLARRLLCSCSVCCRNKALRCVGPARCCCSSATLLNVACSIEFKHCNACSLSSSNRNRRSKIVATGSTQLEMRVRNDHQDTWHRTQRSTRGSTTPAASPDNKVEPKRTPPVALGSRWLPAFRRCAVAGAPSSASLCKGDTVLMKDRTHA